MYRNGKVTEISCNNTQVAVRVQWLDRQGLISKFLPVLQFGSRSTSNFWCPKIADDVTVQMLPNGSEDGFVIGSFYNTSNPPPITDPNTRHITFADGTVIEYAEKGSAKGRNKSGTSGTGTLTINSVGPITIICSGPCSIQAGGQATIQAPTITLQGNVHVTGTLTVDGFTNCKGGGQTNPHMTNVDGLSTNAC